MAFHDYVSLTNFKLAIHSDNINSMITFKKIISIIKFYSVTNFKTNEATAIFSDKALQPQSNTKEELL